MVSRRNRYAPAPSPNLARHGGIRLDSDIVGSVRKLIVCNERIAGFGRAANAL